ncbi:MULTISPECIES: hypothetical protein [unclassified Enterococcus]|uniref:hypothetical protein n=1 Tax=unclassified Enterococcus TaxID=2608891 RepID=UPI0015535D54|nr:MULTISPECIES: hypothetical protein [unclassified Enterococcus]MBS7576387.1 hypothetical protein [Enterococcus sp. MMGLQ5-2]MBS7583619.1 hypothetical protein [Enterococcus sp. MMGLQ5-1]NPD11480.1 hypothetical protein [Enterococcus sp. MMGLQ5-1]NPD36224.1 hypothetical protein [Enterococcus sp. MMGLQ5-2]
MDELKEVKINNLLEPYFFQKLIKLEEEFLAFFDAYDYRNNPKITSIVGKYKLIARYRKNIARTDSLKNDVHHCIKEIHDAVISDVKVKFLICNKKSLMMRDGQSIDNAIRLLTADAEIIEEDIYKQVDTIIHYMLNNAIESALKKAIFRWQLK